MKKILILHGVNLNMFGKRERDQYGTITLDEINKKLKNLAPDLGCSVETFQTNYEGEMAERIHQACEEDVDAVLINAGAWTHYGYAIADALAILTVSVVEVHMSNIHDREKFRHESVMSSVVNGQISGFGLQSYLLGLRAAVDFAVDNGEDSADQWPITAKGRINPARASSVGTNRSLWDIS